MLERYINVWHIITLMEHEAATDERGMMEHIESLIITLLEEIRVDSDVTTDGRTITIKIAPDRRVEE